MGSLLDAKGQLRPEAAHEAVLELLAECLDVGEFIRVSPLAELAKGLRRRLGHAEAAADEVELVRLQYLLKTVEALRNCRDEIPDVSWRNMPVGIAAEIERVRRTGGTAGPPA